MKMNFCLLKNVYNQKETYQKNHNHLIICKLPVRVLSFKTCDLPHPHIFSSFVALYLLL